MADKNTQRDLLIELRTQNVEILRRMDGLEKTVVPRAEYSVMVDKLTEAHKTNQEEINQIQVQINTLIWKIGGGLGALQIITAIVLYTLSQQGT